VSAISYREYTLLCDYKAGEKFAACRAHYGPFNVERSRAEMRRLAAKDGWTHVHEPGMPRSRDQDFCPAHKPAS
jgi:hypothetical protein